IIKLAYILYTGSTTKSSRSNLYLDSLLDAQKTLPHRKVSDVPDFEVKVPVEGVPNLKLRVTFTGGKLTHQRSPDRHGDCEGPLKLVGSAFIKCTIELCSFEAHYPQGQHFGQFFTPQEKVSVLAHSLRIVAKVEFRHFNENMTEQVRVTVDEAGVPVTLVRLEPDVDSMRQLHMFRPAVISKIASVLSNSIPEILADRLILAMDYVRFPLQ
ncbi:unnamed protein product, partial [Ixodes hexagonus]